MIDNDLAKAILKEIRMARSRKFQEDRSVYVKTYKSGYKCLCGNSKYYDTSMCEECYEYQQAWCDR